MHHEGVQQAILLYKTVMLSLMRMVTSYQNADNANFMTAGAYCGYPERPYCRLDK